MPLLGPLEYLHHHTHSWPRVLRYATTLGLVGGAFGLRVAAGPWLEGTAPFTLFYVPILASAALFANGAGYLAACSSSVLCLYFLPPYGVFALPNNTPSLVSFSLFCGCSTLTALVVETLHHSLRLQSATLSALADATRRRALLLTEFRHRVRGDLQGLSSILRLRARHIPNEAAKQALREAAAHTVILGRIHRRLERAQHDADEVAVIEIGEYLIGVCSDMMPPVVGVCAVQGGLSNERAVPLGFVLYELVGEARRDGASAVSVQLGEAKGDYVLDVTDNRPALGEGDTLRERLVGLLVQQLRGRLTWEETPAGGRSARLHFPVLAPVLAPAQVGV